MKETIEKFIDEIYGTHEFASVSKTLLRKMMISSLNPMKIDEERIKEIYNRKSFNNTIQEYNSTLEDHQVLQPLPSEMPSLFANPDNSRDQLWKWLVETYGTPTKKELVSVDKLVEELFKVPFVTIGVIGDITYNYKVLAQYVIDTYSLNPPKREWWMDLKEGDKFMCSNIVHTFKKHCQITKLYFAENYCVDASHCTPYIEPSIHDRLKAKGVTDDEINELINQHEKQEFMKEVKG